MLPQPFGHSYHSDCFIHLSVFCGQHRPLSIIRTTQVLLMTGIIVIFWFESLTAMLVRIQLFYDVAVWLGEWFQTYRRDVMRSCSFETLGNTRPPTERHIPDDLIPKQHLLCEANETAWQKAIFFFNFVTFCTTRIWTVKCMHKRISLGSGSLRFCFLFMCLVTV